VFDIININKENRMSNTKRVMDLMNKYATETAPKAKVVNEARVTVGKVFMQPTKNGTNFKYCYYGMTDASGSFVAGFNMSNKAMLEAVNQGLLPKEFLGTFEAYATKYAETQTVL